VSPASASWKSRLFDPQDATEFEAALKENWELKETILHIRSSCRTYKERAETYEACVYNDGGARAKMTAAIQEELMKKHFETAVELRSKYDRLQEDLKSSWGPAAYAKLQEEVQYWKDVSRELRSVQSEDYEGFFKKQARDLRFHKEQLLWENHGFREMERVMRETNDTLKERFEWTQAQLVAANLSNSSMQEMLEQTKQKLKDAMGGHWAAEKEQRDEIVELRQKLEGLQLTNRVREDQRAMEMEAAAVAAEEQRADMVDLRRRLQRSEEAKEGDCAVLLQAQRDEIADLRQKLSWSQDQMDAVETHVEAQRDEIAELKARRSRWQ